jgi:hypothetical protein
LHSYEEEKRNAFAALANRVLSIVDPQANVVPFNGSKKSRSVRSRPATLSRSL